MSLILKFVATFFVVLSSIGCGSGGGCCSDEVQTPPLATKVKETGKVVEVPEDKNGTIIYVDRNVTVIEYVDRNITVIEYVDRNVTVDVIKVRPVAVIDGLENGAVLEGETLSINPNPSDDIDGNVTAYEWFLDDESISKDKNLTISLPKEEGVHKVCLIVTDNDNLTSLKTCKTFTIPHKNEKPTAVITLPNAKIKTHCPKTFSAANSLSKDGEIVSYIWSIDNNQTFSGIEQELSFLSIGEHKVCLSVIDSNDLSDTQCTTVMVNDHDNPTLKMSMKDENGNIITKDMNLTRGARYDFSCEGSVDDCGNDITSSCEWDAHSYKIVDGKKVDYINNCITHNNSPKVGKTSWVRLCEAKEDYFSYVEITLKATDMFGKTTSSKYIYKVNP